MAVPGYTASTVVAVLVVVLIELLWLRTGIFRTARYWCAMAIVFAFQIPVDGWLTKLSAPVVVYDDRQTLGLRFPWDIPVEDFGFGFAMVTLTILIWTRATDGRSRHGAARSGRTSSQTSAEQEASEIR